MYFQIIYILLGGRGEGGEQGSPKYPIRPPSPHPVTRSLSTSGTKPPPPPSKCPHQQQTTTTFQRAHISSRGVRGCVKRTPRGRVGLWQTPQGHQPAGQCSAMTQTPSGKSELRGSLWEIGITRFPLGNRIYAVPSGGKIGTTRLTLGNRNYAAPSAKSEL